LMGIAGLVGTAQGQKLMIRGLREDGSCLPVAFLDAQCYIASLKTLASSKLWIAADAWKGLWFGGFGVRDHEDYT
jgi:cleavage and polyadenylation specificity factor subunit 1